MKPRNNRERCIARTNYEAGYDDAKIKLVSIISKLEVEVKDLKASHANLRQEAQTKLISAAGQSFEGIARALMAGLNY